MQEEYLNSSMAAQIMAYKGLEVTYSVVMILFHNFQGVAELAYCTAPYELGKVVFTEVIIVGSNPIALSIFR